MNQCLKRTVYQRGTKKQAEFVAAKSGMNERETQLLLLLHDGKDDDFIEYEMGCGRKTVKLIEESMRAKLLLYIFELINLQREAE